MTTPATTPRKRPTMRNPYETPRQAPDRERKTHADPTFREVALRLALQEHRRNAR